MARHRRRGRPKGLKFPRGYKTRRKYRKRGKVGRPKGLKFPHGYKSHRVYHKRGMRGRPSLGFIKVGTYLGNPLFVKRQ